jgi:hypothetical protein
MLLRWNQVPWHKDWVSHSKLIGWDTYTDTQTAKCSHKSTFLFYKIRKVGEKIEIKSCGMIK